MRQVHASICVDLPEGPFTEVVALVKVQPIWDTFLTALVDAEVAHTFKIEILETRAKPATTGAKRGRKARQPQALVPPSDEAA